MGCGLHCQKGNRELSAKMAAFTPQNAQHLTRNWTSDTFQAYGPALVPSANPDRLFPYAVLYLAFNCRTLLSTALLLKLKKQLIVFLSRYRYEQPIDNAAKMNVPSYT